MTAPKEPAVAGTASELTEADVVDARQMLDAVDMDCDVGEFFSETCEVCMMFAQSPAVLRKALDEVERLRARNAELATELAKRDSALDEDARWEPVGVFLNTRRERDAAIARAERAEAELADARAATATAKHELSNVIEPLRAELATARRERALLNDCGARDHATTCGGCMVGMRHVQTERAEAIKERDEARQSEQAALARVAELDALNNAEALRMLLAKSDAKARADEREHIAVIVDNWSRDYRHAAKYEATDIEDSVHDNHAADVLRSLAAAIRANADKPNATKPNDAEVG